MRCAVTALVLRRNRFKRLSYVSSRLQKVSPVPSNRCPAELRASLIVPHLAAEASPNQLRTMRLVDRSFCEEIDRTHAAELLLSPLASGFAPKDPTHFLAHDPPETRGAGHLRAPYLQTQGTLRFHPPPTPKRLCDYVLNYALWSILQPPTSVAQLNARALSLLGGDGENDSLFQVANEFCQKRKDHLQRLVDFVPRLRAFDVVLTDPATDFSFVADWLTGLSDRQQRPFALQFSVENHRLAFRSSDDGCYSGDYRFAQSVTRSLLSLPQTALLTRLDLGALTLFDTQRKKVLFSFASMTGLRELRFRTDELFDYNAHPPSPTESLEGLSLPPTLERLAIHFSVWHYQHHQNRVELPHFAGAFERLLHLRYFCFADGPAVRNALVWEPLLPSLAGLPALCELDLGEELNQELGANNGTQVLAALVVQSSSLRRLALPEYLLPPVELAAVNRASVLALVSRSVNDGGGGSVELMQKTLIPASAAGPASFSTERGAQVSARWLKF